MDSPRSGFHPPDMRWTGHEDFSPPSLSPLHAKVLNYLAEDSTTDLQGTTALSSGLFLETWSEWKPRIDSQVPSEDPMELKTMRLPASGGRQEAEHGEVSECRELDRRQGGSCKEGQGEPGKLAGIEPEVQAGQTLTNPFAATLREVEEDGCHSLPLELRTIRRAPVGEAADRQTGEECYAPPHMTQTLRGCLLQDEGLDAELSEEAVELRTMRRTEAALMEPSAPGVLEEMKAELQAKGDLVPCSTSRHRPEACAEGENHGEASPDALTGSKEGVGMFDGSCLPLALAQIGSEAKATSAELDDEREVLEAATATQSLKMSQQSSHLTELVSEGPGPPPPVERPDAGVAWEELAPVPCSEEGQAATSAGEVRPGTLQDSASSPAHSAVTTPATSGYQTLPKGAPDPVEIPALVDPVPGTAVFTAEDEAVVGLKRRGGVEVVVESPRAKANGCQEPVSAGSERREGSAPLSRKSESPAPDSLGLQGAPAPMVVRQGRPPRQPATPAGSVTGSMESEQPGPGRRRVPSVGRRPSLPKADAARRSSSAGRPLGLQPNRKLVRNALEKCLKGEANREQREQVLKSFDEDLERFDRLIILFRSIHTGRHDLRALYGFAEGSWSRVLQILPSPASLEERMVVQCLRYDSGGKEFKEVPALQEPLSVADAVFLYPQFLQRSRVVVP